MVCWYNLIEQGLISYSCACPATGCMTNRSRKSTGFNTNNGSVLFKCSESDSDCAYTIPGP